MTVAALARHAAERPDAPAAIVNGRIHAYRDLHRHIGAFSGAIAALDLPPRATVAIECHDPLLHLILMLACEQLGACTLSLAAPDLARPLPLLAELDLLISEQASQTAARRTQRVTRAWIEAAIAAGIDYRGSPPAPYAPDDAVRLVRTSGTTGTPKLIRLTHRVVEARIESWRQLYRASAGDRHFIASTFAVNAMYWQAAVALRLGGSVAFETRTGLAEALAATEPSHVVLLPILLGTLLERIGPEFAKPARLTLLCIGGRVAPGLRRQACERLATRLAEVYSSNEAGNIAVTEDDDPRATVLPEVEVEIVGARGKPVRRGRAGTIRVRTPYMIDGIAGDAEATAQLFKDGWFHPGDAGLRTADGLLEVLGRADELMNLGGVKVQPGEIEDVVRAGAPVSDAAACLVRGDDGSDAVWIAVCFGGDMDGELVEKIRPAFRDFPYGPANLVQLPAIPRTETGKVKRDELRRVVAEALQAGRGRPSVPAARR
jgi:acyl-CoA synthetase (AMP-forming)/AMP-acid ligase II